MSCARAREWPALLGHRFERDGEAPAGFAEALAHAGACMDCRRVALRVDPSLLFGLLAGRAPAEAQREAEGEVESMRAAVDHLRRVRCLGAPDRRPRRGAAWRWPAAAGFLLAVLSLTPAAVVQRAPTLPPGAAAPAILAFSPPASSAQWSIAPVVEPLGGEARIYELDSASDLAVVLIVDQTIDV